MGWPRIISVLNSLVIIILIFTSSSLVIGEDHEGSSDPLDWLRASIPGEPELDYPILGEIAETSFSCNGRIFGGYYADPEMQCQGYHVCLTPPNAFMDRKTSFLCPNGTIFSQSLLTCDWWFNVDCSESEEFYNINEKIGSEEPIADDNDVTSDSKPQSQTSQRRQQEPKPQSQSPQQSVLEEEEEEEVAPQIEPQLNNIDFRQGQDQAFGVGSASIQSLNEEPQEVIDIVEYDATIPGEDDDVDVPILLADPFQEIEETEEPLALYGAPPRSGRTRSSRTRSSGRKRSGRRGSGRRGRGRTSRKRPSRKRSGRG